METIGMCWGSRYDNRWDEKLRLMEQYHRERGKLEVPKGYTVKGVRLGRWVARSSPGSSHYWLEEGQSADAIQMWIAEL